MTRSAVGDGLIITGPVGVGKSSIAEAASALLVSAAVPHGAVDLDWLYSGYWELVPDSIGMAVRNLEAVWSNYREAGATHLIISGVVEAADHVDRYRNAAHLESMTVCRLTASPKTIEARLRCRNSGDSLLWHLRRAREHSERMERAGLSDMVVDTEHRDHTTIASDVLARIGWLS